MFLVLAIAWLGDTGGYFAGRALGRHKLYPRVSPKKTWEGLIACVVTTMAAAAVMKLLFLDLDWLHILVLGAIGVIIVIQRGIGNFFRNLNYPVTGLNQLLQGKFSEFGESTERFLANTIFGLLGFVDIASKGGVPQHDRGRAGAPIDPPPPIRYNAARDRR